MHKIIVFLAVVVFLLTANLPAAAAQDVPSDIYQWVQASPRISYYFNKAEMKYAVGSDGMADTNVLEVPVLQQFDWIEIQDVTEKRRWNNEDVTGFSNLWGFAGIVHIDLKARTAVYVQEEYLNTWWSSIAVFTSNNVDNIDKMSEKNLDRIFYDNIISYAAAHKIELMQRQHDQLKPDDLKAAGLTEKQTPAGDKKTEKQKVKEIMDRYQTDK
ncbi:hypothetical protein [Pectinatus haikarae]|uniref:Uncharacterized protein n=1 Tax=Pectinatus haikarae TaxID=349096 RepID=A0ABT9Y9B8_9FIRM|nr:hypothetical protein [Pectinatus haikarae]MDQ0204326.1 hypothetical protein [Pectinatus haikarae]